MAWLEEKPDGERHDHIWMHWRWKKSDNTPGPLCCPITWGWGEGKVDYYVVLPHEDR